MAWNFEGVSRYFESWRGSKVNCHHMALIQLIFWFFFLARQFLLLLLLFQFQFEFLNSNSFIWIFEDVQVNFKQLPIKFLHSFVVVLCHFGFRVWRFNAGTSHKGNEEFQIYVVVLCHFGLRVGRFNVWTSQGKWGVPNLYFFYAILGLRLGDSMHELHKGNEEFQIYVVFYASLGLGLGDSMHELHKGSEKFQIYVVFNAILGLGLGDSNAWAP